MKMGYGEFIAKHRKLSGFKSQRRLAEKSKITSATLSRIESEVQKPNPETLKQLSPFLTSTTLVELMVVCGYWDEDELLEKQNVVSEKPSSYSAEKEKTPLKNEEEFIESIDLTDNELLEQFDLKVDGRSLSEVEAKGIIAYIRSLRQMNQ
jgi:transcriptional regulator with XRE-family HTH domain